VGTSGRGTSCAAVFDVVTGRAVVDVAELIDGVRGDVGDFKESAVLLRFKAINSSFSASDGCVRAVVGCDDVDDDREDISSGLEGEVIEAIVETSVSGSESVPEDEISLVDEESGRSTSSEVAECEA
jgi:hypothetical protein